jgi:hypothetical protein
MELAVEIHDVDEPALPAFRCFWRLDIVSGTSVQQFALRHSLCDLNASIHAYGGQCALKLHVLADSVLLVTCTLLVRYPPTATTRVLSKKPEAPDMINTRIYINPIQGDRS